MIIKDYYKEAVELMISLEFNGLDHTVTVHTDQSYELTLDKFLSDFDAFTDFEHLPEWCEEEWGDDEALFIGSFIGDLILLKIIKV